ncbi:hypothetical protein Gotur_009595 [Gossypium turneri]
MFCGNCTYVRFRYERLSLFCFYCGRLGYNDSFCEAQMALGVEVAKMGWDLSLRAQSQRAAAMNNVLLREDGDGKPKGDGECTFMNESNLWTGENKIVGYGQSFDPVLEDSVLIGEEEKKRARGEMEGAMRLPRGKPTSAMKLLSWNVRGLGSLRVIRRLRYMLKLQNPQLVFFMETKICRSQMERIRYSCGYVNGIEVDPEGTRGGLCLAWKLEVCVTLRQYSKRDIDVVVNDSDVRDCSLVDMGFSRRWFTWEKENLPETNIRKRLDRGVANEEWMAMFPEVTIQHLTHSFSDHCPLLVNIKKAEQGVKGKTFRFEAWWTMDETFDEEVKNIWGSSSGNLMQKLDKLKHGLRSWVARTQADRKKRKIFLTNSLSEF